MTEKQTTHLEQNSIVEQPELEPQKDKVGFFRSLLHAPKFGDPAKDRIAGLQHNVIVGIFFSALLGMGISFALWSGPKSISGLTILLVELFLSVLAFYFQRSGHLNRSSWVLASAMYLVFSLIFSLTGFTFPAALVLTLTLLVVGLLLSYRSVIVITVLLQATLWILPAFVVMPITAPLTSLVYISVTVGLLGLLLVISSRALEKAFAEADKSTKDVLRANKDLQSLTTNLEHRVADRTKALSRQALQLHAATEVSRAVSSELDADQLVEKAVNLVRNRFELYYVGLFLLDEDGRFAVLDAGTGEAGREMLAAAHKLEVNDDSMIGWCIAHQEARIALDTGQQAARFLNPLLPETRSELALPLISQGQVIGAMTVQSTQEAAFTEEDITTLQTMTDQLANGIEKARLYKQVQLRAAELAKARESADAAKDDAEKARVTAEEANRNLAAQMWHTAGQSILNEKMRGEQDIPSLANNVIQQLCEYLNAQSGMIYMFETNLLKLRGTYAYRHRENIEQFEMGESMIGQAAISKHPITVHVPVDTLTAPTSAADLTPCHFIVTPAVYDGQLIGVIEIGSITEFTPAQTEFLNKAIESIAIAFMTAQARARMNELFSQTRQQAEELQAQGEELRATNEELEAQTESLRASENRFKNNQTTTKLKM